MWVKAIPLLEEKPNNTLEWGKWLFLKSFRGKKRSRSPLGHVSKMRKLPQGQRIAVDKRRVPYLLWAHLPLGALHTHTGKSPSGPLYQGGLELQMETSNTDKGPIITIFQEADSQQIRQNNSRLELSGGKNTLQRNWLVHDCPCPFIYFVFKFW